MHPEFPEIWKGLSEMGFFLTLQTNGSMITGEIQTLLEQYPPRQVKITLYGSNDEVYEAVCGVKKGFTRVNDGIHTLMSMGIPVTLVSTIIRQNAEDEEQMAFYAYVHRLPWISTANVKNSQRHKGIDTTSVYLFEKLEKNWKEDVHKRHFNKIFFEKEKKPCTYCRDYRVGYWIFGNGMMRFCSFLDKPDISIRTLSFKTAWEQLLSYEEELEWPEKCRNCNAFKVCAKCVASILTEYDHGYSENKYCKIIQSKYSQIIKEERSEKKC